MNSTKSTFTGRGLGVMFAVAAVLVVLVLPVSASADCGPTTSQYAVPSNPIDCQPVSSGGGGGGTLPFTGMDIVPLAGIALALAGAGFAIRRYSRESARL
jgi:hypothetical protein